VNKKLKLVLITGVAVFMIVTWALIYFSHTVAKPVNNWWQVAMGLAALLYATLGIFTAAKWSWLRSGVGRGVFFISLALLMWGVGQLGWSYFLFVNPDVQSPPSHLLDIADFSAIPLWFLGILMLYKATGARYGLRHARNKIIVTVIILLMSALSWYLLVEVARGGTGYFKEAFWQQFFDLGYSIGDAVIAITAVGIYLLSRKLLGGRFRIPILVILAAFVFLYLADFLYSYLAGKNTYYNGDVADLLYMITISVFGVGVNMLDPSSFHAGPPATALSTDAPTAIPPADPMSYPSGSRTPAAPNITNPEERR
jgi:hypothetical protein